MCEKFLEATSKYLCVKALDLKRWALEEADKLRFEINASQSFITQFQKKYSIVSRKITKLTANVERGNASFESGVQVVLAAKQKFREVQISRQLVFNTDQSGFTYEVH